MSVTPISQTPSILLPVTQKTTAVPIAATDSDGDHDGSVGETSDSKGASRLNIKA